ncbi:MAG: efflux RND transporter periplasmic adaptor subunit [Candidatus Stahlbacteria bacterium]|nr:MAG: efflux RND transporter periplasmic adaptor subunit [Candidatus Stahlbacteria bacterium]
MNKKKRKRRLALRLGIPARVVFVLIIVCVVQCRLPRTPQVTVTELGKRRIVSTVSATGELRAANQVDISAEILARVSRLYVKEGQEVRKGELLCVLDDAALLSSRDLSRANFDEASAAYKRGEALYRDTLISTAEFERVRTAFEVAKAQLDQSEDRLAKTRIYAPISGRVVRLNIEEGEAVMMGTMNNPGTIMMTIADLAAMQARVDVDESDVVDLRTGQRTQVKLDAMPDTAFAAAVRSISYMPSTNLTSAAEGVTDFEVILDLVDIDPAQRPGMSVSADITTAMREDVITCPLQAIGRREVEGKLSETVFVLEDGKAKLVSIETGISDGRFIEIIEGIKEGQTVIIGPYKVLRTLQDGDEVKPSKGETEWQERSDGPQVRRVRVRT